MFEYLSSLDTKQLHVIHTLSRMHFILHHQFITDEIDNDAETKDDIDENLDDTGQGNGNNSGVRKRIIRSREAMIRITLDADIGEETKFNKFVNDVGDGEDSDESETDTVSGGVRDTIWDRFVEAGVDKESATSFMEYLIVNDYDTDAIIDDIVDEDDKWLQYTQSNLFKELSNSYNKYYMMKLIKNELDIDGNDNDNVPSFKLIKNNLYTLNITKSIKQKRDTSHLQNMYH